MSETPFGLRTVHSSRLDLRERLLTYGVEALSSVELLAVLLGSGTSRGNALQLALQLLEGEGVSSALFRDPERLRRSHGIGDAKAARVLAAFELGRRACFSPVQPRQAVLRSLQDVSSWAWPRLAGLDHEELWLLCLDARNRLRASVHLAKGGALSCSLVPADVLRPAVRNGATALILVHNHPSGDPTPSADDCRVTHAIAQACRLVGVPLLDHVVVAAGGAASVMSGEKTTARHAASVINK